MEKSTKKKMHYSSKCEDVLIPGETVLKGTSVMSSWVVDGAGVLRDGWILPGSVVVRARLYVAVNVTQLAFL